MADTNDNEDTWCDVCLRQTNHFAEEHYHCERCSSDVTIRHFECYKCHGCVAPNRREQCGYEVYTSVKCLTCKMWWEDFDALLGRYEGNS